MSGKSIDNDNVQKKLATLTNPWAKVEDKRDAFQFLQACFAPVTNHTRDYATEVRLVHDLQFNPWPSPPEDALHGNHVGDGGIEMADRIRGLIFGTALGDAMGLATEFMSKDEVEKNYSSEQCHTFRPGEDVFPDRHRMRFPQGDWTDDTDQMLLILQTLLESGGMYDGSTFASKFDNWVNTGFSELGDCGGMGVGWTTRAVVSSPGFVSNPQLVARQIWENGGRCAAPNGAVMRTAITGVPFYWDAEIVEANTINFSKCAHADPRCVASCITIAECVRNLIISSSDAHYSAQETSDDTNTIIHRAAQRAKSYLDKEKANDTSHASDSYISEFEHYIHIPTLDELQLDSSDSIGYTFKCMGTALWALREVERELQQSVLNAKQDAGKASDDEDEEDQKTSRQGRRQVAVNILQRIVRQGGDADTNATVAGALIGARLGYSSLPTDWILELPYFAWLEAWVNRLLFMMSLPTQMNDSNGVPFCPSSVEDDDEHLCTP